jgi:hypothetical protein
MATEFADSVFLGILGGIPQEDVRLLKLAAVRGIGIV